MKSLWNDKEAIRAGHDALDLRVYTSRLLGRDSSLVLHGGGNTSVKAEAKDLFGETKEVLFVKGSGWDLATIEREGFAPVMLGPLKKMAEIHSLSDSKMVTMQRSVMLDPHAPNPSVEAILHAIIPFKYVDHTHADAVVTITNTPGGRKRIQEIYGNKILIVPYVMPGFILAKTIFEMTKAVDWAGIEGMILMNHGVFTFNDDPRESYENMVAVVSKAERYLKKQAKRPMVRPHRLDDNKHFIQLAQIRKVVSVAKGCAQIVNWQAEPKQIGFSSQSNVKSLISRGPLTPDHVIRTKRVGIFINDNIQACLDEFINAYNEYFNAYKTKKLTPLDPVPKWGVWKNKGVLSFGDTVGETKIISDIIDHTIDAINNAEQIKSWKALSAKDIFDVEYWELEQAKLKKSGLGVSFQGKIALVTGAANGIGKACVDGLIAQGCVVAALDIDPKITNMFNSSKVLGLACDVTKENQIKKCADQVVRKFGGLDIVISNAGIFPQGELIEEISRATWDKSVDINLTSHQLLLKYTIPYLTYGIDSSFIVIASKNVPAPGPGAGAYSVAKAGLTQLARVAALELGPKGVRVNIIHPNQVFDTAIWTDEVLKNRASYYKMTVKEYKTNNLLKTEITSHDVARLACVMAGPVFSKTTGSQVAIDGGNDRVI